MSLEDIYNGVSESMESKKSELVALLEEHIDLDEWIPYKFREAFYGKMGRDHIYHLESFLWFIILKKLFGLSQNTQMISILKCSSELRDLCGFNKVPDASQIMRFIAHNAGLDQRILKQQNRFGIRHFIIQSEIWKARKTHTVIDLILGLPALLFLSRINANAMIGRKLSQSMIFSRSRQSPSSLNFCNLFSSANREICFIFWTLFPCSASIISCFAKFCNRAPLNISRATSSEKIFASLSKKVERSSPYAKAFFVTNDEKASGDSWCAGFLEVPNGVGIFRGPYSDCNVSKAIRFSALQHETRHNVNNL